MRTCPYCGVAIESIHGTGSAAIEERGKTTKRAMDVYSCGACGGEFALVRGRVTKMLLRARDVDGMRLRLDRATASNKVLKRRVSDLLRENRSLAASLRASKEKDRTRNLWSRVTELETQVAFLRKEKGRLEEHLARLG